MVSRRFLFALAAFISAVAAKTQNMSAQYAILTISHEWQIYLLEQLIETGSNPGLMTKLKPVKQQIQSQLASGKGDLNILDKAITEFLAAADAESPGFRAAALDFAGENTIDFYAISKVTPEASWDFIYQAAKKAAADIKNSKIANNLEKLNADVEPTFSATVDVAALVGKIDKFTLDSEAISPGYTDYILIAGDSEIEIYRAKLLKLNNGETVPADPTTAPSTAGSSFASASTSTSGSRASSGSSSGKEPRTTEPATPIETPAGQNETTTVPAKTPVPSMTSSATSLSSVLTVGVSVAAVMLSYLTL